MLKRMTLVLILALGVVALAAAQLNLLQAQFDHGDIVLGATWNADETLVLTYSSDSTARISDIDGTQLVEFTAADAITGALWNGDESLLVTWGDGANALLWASTGELLATLAHGDGVNGALWNGDETFLLTSALDGTARIWSATGNEVASLQFTDAAGGATWLGDDSQVLFWADDGTVTLSGFDGIDLSEVYTLQLGAGVIDAEMNGDLSRLITLTDTDTGITVWEGDTGEPITVLEHGDLMAGATWSSDDRILGWSEDGSARIWESGVAPVILPHNTPVIHAEWVNGETQVLTIAQDDPVFYLWNASTGELVQSFDHEDIFVRGAAMSPDGTQIVSWLEDPGTLRVWSVDTGLVTATLEHAGTEFGVLGAVWSADSSQILSWGGDSSARIWQASAIPSF